jgi:hypothetical protein
MNLGHFSIPFNYLYPSLSHAASRPHSASFTHRNPTPPE